jgi:hypothetical protein
VWPYSEHLKQVKRVDAKGEDEFSATELEEATSKCQSWKPPRPQGAHFLF